MAYFWMAVIIPPKAIGSVLLSSAAKSVLVTIFPGFFSALGRRHPTQHVGEAIETQGPEYRLQMQHTAIPIVRTPKKEAPNFGKPPFGEFQKLGTPVGGHCSKDLSM